MFKIANDILCLRAPNPSPLTADGTNTYVVGSDRLVVIDPGPMIESHMTRLIELIDGRPVDAVIVTHSHLDHSPMARPLADAVNAPVLAFGDSHAGRSRVMSELAGHVGGGEGIDPDFKPDRCLTDGEVIFGLTVVHTPGHMGNHICLVRGDIVFTGDHIMGWATSLVSPPDGDLTDFMASCRKLRTIPARLYLPGHGAPVEDPIARLDWIVAHRLQREAQILEALSGGNQDADALVARLYADVPRALWPAAKRNVIAHLVDLVQQRRVVPVGEMAIDTVFALV